jgi:hypothetical protein
MKPLEFNAFMQNKLETYSKQASYGTFDYQKFKEWLSKDWYDEYPGYPLRVHGNQGRLWFEKIMRYASLYKLNRKA